jgi:hypothetical protein
MLGIVAAVEGGDASGTEVEAFGQVGGQDGRTKVRMLGQQPEGHPEVRLTATHRLGQLEAPGRERQGLGECDLISDLNGHTFEEMPLSLRLRVKRAAVRTIVIKRQSKSFLRYEQKPCSIGHGSRIVPKRGCGLERWR